VGLKQDIVEVGILAAVGYAAWKYFVSPTASKATDAASSAIANAYVGVTNWLYGSSTMVPTGNVILPNGQKVPISQVQHMTWDDAAGVASFVYNGYGYIIRPNPDGGPAYDTNGDYHAE
jgi:hypothetical protein